MVRRERLAIDEGRVPLSRLVLIQLRERKGMSGESAVGERRQKAQQSTDAQLSQRSQAAQARRHCAAELVDIEIAAQGEEVRF